MNKKLMLMLLVGFSAQVVTNDEDFNDNLEEMPFYPCEDFSSRCSDYTETIFLSDIIVEYGPILETYPAQQYITLKYEDAVRHDKIEFKNDNEQAEQLILGKEYFRRDLLNVFHAITIDFNDYCPCVCGWVPSARLHYSGFERRFGGYIDGSFHIRFHNLDHTIFKAKKEFRNWIISQDSICYLD